MRHKTLSILFRVDSSENIGLGHTMRCLVLAQRLKEQNAKLAISFATQALANNIDDRIVALGFTLHTLFTNEHKEFLNVVQSNPYDLIIIDSYQLDIKIEKLLQKQTQAKLLIFDDMFQAHSANMVLNHGIHVDKNAYKDLVPQTTKVFAGMAYTLLRDEFFLSYQTKRKRKSIAIILGGNDAANLSLSIARMLEHRYKISIITTTANPHLKKLQKHTTFKLFVDINNIAEILSQQSCIICASGGNLFEVMALKLPFINIQIAQNQASIVHFLKEKNIHTTLQKEEINLENLQKKLIYLHKTDIYKNLELQFSKDTLAKKILKELNK